MVPLGKKAFPRLDSEECSPITDTEEFHDVTKSMALHFDTPRTESMGC